MDPYEEMRLIDTIAKRIAAFSGVRRIMLFGSRAEGRARLDSDFDICVVTIDGAAGESAYIEMRMTPYIGWNSRRMTLRARRY